MSAGDGTKRRARPYYVTGGSLRLVDGRTITIGTEPVTLGRGTGADVALDDPEVSALHCELWASQRGVVVRDLDSTNGTRLGSASVSEAVLHGRCTLRVGATDVEFEPAAAPQRVDDASQLESFGPLVGATPSMRHLYARLATVAPTELSVLITGAAGTGKEVTARAIHGASERRGGPFVVVDCGALLAGEAEAGLFDRMAEAAGGTLLLDEIDELPERLQPKLLRALVDGKMKRAGQERAEPMDARIVTTTRRDLRREMNAERFREDLYHRLARVRLELTPLRTRRADIPLLVTATCERMNKTSAASRVRDYIEARFRNYDWPGNVRELVNVASVLTAIDDEQAADVLPLEGGGGSTEAQRFAQAKRRFEEDYFRHLLEATDGNISEISRRCGLARHQVRRHLRKLGLMS